MYTIRVDVLKNRIYATFVGFFTKEEMKQCADETIAATKKLRPGYDIITDITQFKTGTQDVAAEIRRVQAHFRKSGARQGVRVVGGNVPTNMQFTRTGAMVGYSSVTVATVEQAEALLDDLCRRAS